MAFQDFDLLKERQRIDNERKLKRNVTIGIVVSVVVVAAVVAIVCIDLNTRNDPENPAKKTKPHDDKDYSVSKSLKTTVKTVCASTDYKATCESSLGNVIHSNPSQKHQPKDLLKASFSVVSNELDKAMKQPSKFKLDTPEKKEAFEVCKKVISDAKQELNSSADTVGKNDIGTLTWKKHDLNNWLSAVMSYQQTCIDSFPEGDAKTEIKKALQNSKELTSNSLAIVSQFSSIISSIQKPKRHLLSVSKNRSSHAENFTTWMSIEERRMLKVDPPKQKPDVTVAKDGSGDFQTINDALAKLPQNHHGRYVIFIKEGEYNENVLVTKKMVNITIFGDGSLKTIITGNKNNVDGIPTLKTATFAAEGDGFMAQSIGFRNTAGPEKHQAVALRVQSDRSIFLNCRMEGYQDTLYVQAHRQFYRGCYIAGTVDFIFGDAAAILQNCLIDIRKPMDGQKNTVTAQGRPWKEFSRTIVIETEIDDIIDPQGWLPWQGNFALSTLYYGEYNNKGSGSDVKNRVKWPGFKVIKKGEAMKYTVGPFVQGDSWLKGDVGTPVHFGLFN
ncbi:Pectinesterase [Heracleum sosnowskyi]|uniref:Pectinesterase n=1 Tax=Heracleum sosnowskyi TaxID=360622 RepID=A0AAD8HFC5_9APIA|nr:Pectinesterase [Heracleum sosnowskyi]